MRSSSTQDEEKKRLYGKVKCENKHIDEEVLYKVFVSSFNALVKNKEEFIENWKAEEGDEFKRYKARAFIGLIRDRIEEFDVDLFFKMVEKIMVFEDSI